VTRPRMTQAIQAGHPRMPVGSCVNVRDYIPHTYENNDYIFNSRSFSILQLKVGGKNFSRDPSLREALRKRRIGWLQTNYGLSEMKASILVGRGPSAIRRIEDTIHGVIDSLLLFDLSLFRRDNTEGRKVIRYLVRMILTIAPYGVGTIVTYWKEFSSFLYNRFAGLQPVLPQPGRENFVFRAMANHPDILRMLGGEVDKSLCEKFAHLTSSRQLATGDRRAERDSMRTFLRNVEKPYPTDVRHLNLVHTLARRVGEKSYFLAKDWPSLPHISLSCAGSYYETVKDGGRGKEIRESLNEYLTVTPEEDEEISTPIGQLSCPKGEPRWRHWCRKTPYTHYPEIRFGEPITEEVFAEQNLYYQGFDEAIGNQILAVSMLEYGAWSKTGLGIPIRALTVPEPGYKARIVTTGPFWLNILQQSLAHYVRGVLAAHPSARSCMLKTDQAWQSLYLMSGKEYPKEFLCLSSDLKEATDNIPKDVGIQLLTGFLEGCGQRSRLTTTCCDLLRMNRDIITDYGVSTRQSRGIMMGEPLAKGILTILNLCAEEYAMRTFLEVPYGVRHYVSPPWRTFHVGGDDHIAIGPPEYLRKITEFHTKCGSVLSTGKHGMSNKVVTYCEKVLEIRRIYSPFNVRTINDSTEHYEASPFVDSIKVRLLSPLTKAFEVSSERNVAIGKGLSLGRTLKWLNKDHYPTKWVRMVRDRFFERMGSLLPDRTSGIYWQLLLPSYWGGLDLYIPDEVGRLYKEVPELTKSIMESYLQDESKAHEEVKLLRKFLTNYSYRGFVLDENEVQAMTSHLEMIIGNLPRSTWWEIKREFDPEGLLSAKDVVDRAYRDGWKGESDIIDVLLRPILFKEILLGKERPKPYNTVRLKRRYATLWDRLYKGDSTLSAEDFRKAVLGRPQDPFYKVDYPKEIHFASDRGYIYTSVLDDALHGMPKLSLDPRYV